MVLTVDRNKRIGAFLVSNRQPVVAATLAIAVAWAGVVCACTLPSVEPTGATGHHAHHGMHGMEASPSMACAHVDCLGDCGVDATQPKDQATTPELPKTSLDDLAVVVPSGSVAVAARVPSYHHPPWRTARPVDSPISRFDRLLN